ncbi:MAG: TlpA disulfide reductase family protein [Myxococcota bacterium]
MTRIAKLLVLLLAASCVRREPLPPLTGPAMPAAPLIFQLPTYPGGELHDLTADRGQVVLLDVWATWCEPCRDSLPLYEQLLKHYGDRGFRVYTLNVDEDPRQIAPFVEQTKLSLPILLDQRAAVSERMLRVRVMPSSFLLDKKGVVRFVHEGFAEEFLARYQTEIEELLAEPAE